ncbi:hypothetical protein ACNSOO_04700 [Aliarcobacter lanthieri]|uniref:phage adaptor protein n=1 Tax=Aliarcobacter lanthieri TaxID=1355374 RepID=UPI003AAA7819
MIQANDIILLMRSRLGDADAKKWSDEELIDYINSSLADISKELEPFTHQEYILLKEKENRYRLPHNTLRVLSVNIDDKPITIKSYEWLIQNKKNINDICVAFDEQSFFLYPIEKISAGKKVEINYKFIEQIEKKQDFIKISTLAKKAILYHSLHLAYQAINIVDKNVGKTTQFLNLYDKELSTLRITYFKNKHSKKIKTKFRSF